MLAETIDVARATGGADGLVTLTVGEQMCGVPVLRVRDVLGPQAIARIPLAPEEVAGSLNLRGRIVTAIDVRRRLGVPPRAASQPPPMAVVVEQEGEFYALLVDHVAEVMTPAPETFDRNPPTLGAAWAECSAGIFRLPDRLLVVLDVTKLLMITEKG